MKKETLNPREHFTSVDAHERAASAQASLARAEEVCTARTASLESLAFSIGSRLYEALAQKIEHERASLLSLLERREHIAETKRQLDKVLKTEYFTYRTLDTHLL